MKKIFKQFFKQIIILIILIASVLILNMIFVGTSIKGDYDVITAGITKGADTREVEKYLKDIFKQELDYNKKIEVEAVGSFGTEFRIKSDSFTNDERDFMSIMMKEKYEDATLSAVSNNPEANYRVDYIMYGTYLIIILVVGFISLYFLYLIPINDEITIKNIKKTKDELIKEENLKLDKKERKRIKEEKKKEKQYKKGLNNKNKKQKKDNKSKDKKDNKVNKNKS